MAYNSTKGLVAVATAHNDTTYTYRVLSELQADGSGITPDRVQDLDSYVNGDGKLKRTVLPHTRTSIKLTTTLMTEAEKQSFIKALRDGMSVDASTSVAERKVRLRYYNDWVADYKTGYFYVPDVEFRHSIELNGILYYQPITIEFVEY